MWTVVEGLEKKVEAVTIILQGSGLKGKVWKRMGQRVACTVADNYTERDHPDRLTLSLQKTK